MQSLTQAQEFGAKKLRRLPLKTFGPKGCCPVLNVDCVAWVPGGNDNPLKPTIWGNDFWVLIPQKKVFERLYDISRCHAATTLGSKVVVGNFF